MNFLKEHVNDEIPGVPLPFIENNDKATYKRAAGCAVLDKVHEKWNIYNKPGAKWAAGIAWGDWCHHKNDCDATAP